MVVSNLFFSLMEIRRANYEQSVILSEYLEEDLVFDTIFVKVIVPFKSFNLRSKSPDFLGLHYMILPVYH